MAQKELEERRDELEAEEQAIEKRLAEIQSLLGNLSVGLTESMLLFPMTLSAGFIMLTSSFTTAVRLRKILHGFYQPSDLPQIR